MNQLELAWSHRQLSHTWQEYNLHDTCPSESGNFEPGRFRQCLQSSVCVKSTGKVEHALSITFSALIWARNSSKHGTVVHQFISLSLTFNDIRSKSVGTIVWSQLTPKVERFYGDQLISSSENCFWVAFT